jgi:hypothetical protein
MARQSGREQLELSNIDLVMNVGIMAKGMFSQTTIKRIQYLMTKPHDNVPTERQLGVELVCAKNCDGCVRKILSFGY